MLQNEYLVAKIGVDTAENEPLQILMKIYKSFRIRAAQNCEHLVDLEKC